jgi:hypothetical protein
MYKFAILAVLIEVIIIWSPLDAEAQLTRRGEVNPADVYNPKPDDGDIILPMPCDLKMVFKAVSLPVKGHLKDFETRLGTEEEHPNGFFDRKYKAFLGSALSLANLPQAFQSVALKTVKPEETDQLYLIGKYEVTVGQWQAVMEGCPSITPESALPKSGVTWFNTLAFTEKYMLYLLENHPEILPSFPNDNKEVGIIRLPTEAEWEYAARGGQAVSSDNIRSEQLFPIESGFSAADYGLFQDGISPPAQGPGTIGRFRPNPLGIYDTVGNVAEMTSDMFKMSVGDRLHGATGGVTRKGGSYRSDTAEIMPGRRQEAALFYRNGPVVSGDLGFRLTLSAVAAPGETRLGQLVNEWENITQAPQMAESLNPLEKIERLIKGADNSEEKAVYESLRADLRDYNIMVQRNQEAAARAHCRSLLYAVYSIRNSNILKINTERNIEITETDIEFARQNLNSASAREKKQLNDLIAEYRTTLTQFKKEIGDFDQAIRNQFNYYKVLIEDSVDFDRKMLIDQMVFVRNDIKGNDVHSQEMRTCYDAAAKHLSLMLKGQSRQIKVSDLLSAKKKK